VTQKEISIDEKRVKHIFRHENGHLTDSAEHRKLLADTASDSRNYLGTDRFGNEWYAKTLEDGSQIWTQVRKGQITNGGLNPNPRIYNSQSGLSNLMKPETGD